MESGAAAEPTATHFTYRLVHLGAGVADDVDALGQQVPGKETEEGREGLAWSARHGAARRKAGRTFFLARSPEAPSTTMRVLDSRACAAEPPDEGISEVEDELIGDDIAGRRGGSEEGPA